MADIPRFDSILQVVIYATGHKKHMCGRVVQVSDPIRLSIIDGLGVRETRLSNYPRRWNAAPSQELFVIRENHNTGERSLDLLKWGLISYWCAVPAECELLAVQATQDRCFLTL